MSDALRTVLDHAADRAQHPERAIAAAFGVAAGLGLLGWVIRRL